MVESAKWGRRAAVVDVGQLGRGAKLRSSGIGGVSVGGASAGDSSDTWAVWPFAGSTLVFAFSFEAALSSSGSVGFAMSLRRKNSPLGSTS